MCECGSRVCEAVKKAKNIVDKYKEKKKRYKKMCTHKYV